MTENEFEKALTEACKMYAEEEVRRIDEAMKDYNYEPSNRFKIKMNRLFREQVGSKNIPHPEVDTPFEKFRSNCIRRYLVLEHRLKTKIKS